MPYWYKKYKNRPRNAGVIIENKVAHFFYSFIIFLLYFDDCVVNIALMHQQS